VSEAGRKNVGSAEDERELRAASRLKKGTDSPLTSDSSDILTNDGLQLMKPMKSNRLDVNVNDWHNQTCLGMECEEPGNSSITPKAVPKLVNFLSSTEKTSQEANSLCVQHPAPQRGSKSLNGSESSGVNLSISTISYLQLSALQSMSVRALSGRKRGDLSEHGRVRRKSHKACES